MTAPAPYCGKDDPRHDMTCYHGDCMGCCLVCTPADCEQDEPTYCGCCGNEITDHRIGVVQSWCGPCCAHIATRGPSWERTYEAINGEPCPFQVCTDPYHTDEYCGRRST